MTISINLPALAVGVPVAAGILCLIIPDKTKLLARLVAVAVTAASMAVSVLVFIRKPLYWPPVMNPTFFVDDLGALSGLGVSFFALIVAIYSLGFISRHNGRFFGYLLMTLGSALGAVYSNNLIMLVVFWGALAALLYLMVSIDAGQKASAAAKKSLIIIGATDALMIFAVGLIWKMSGTFLIEGTHIELDGPMPYIAYILMAIAGLAKAGAMPFHSWLPEVAENAPAPVTAYLPASLDKFLGIYLLARASLSIFAMNVFSNTFLLIIGAVTIVLAVAIALVQHDLKRLLGYHAVSKVGYMVLGIGTGTAVGIAGGLFHMVNNAVYKSCLFLGGGNVEKRAGTTDLSALGGLARYMPVTFLCFLTASLSISGIPPLNGFVSKWMVYQGIVQLGASKNPGWVIWLVAAMFGSAMTVASFVKLLHSIFLGRGNPSLGGIKEAGIHMLIPVFALAFICVVFGVFAFLLPIPVFIIPALGEMAVEYLGTWEPGIATALLLAGIAAGLFIYLFVAPKKARLTGTFIGGEDPRSLDRVTGAEFYDTIKENAVLSGIYRNEGKSLFDIYYLGKRLTAWLAGMLQGLHNGILPTYLAWCLLGMIAIFITLFLR